MDDYIGVANGADFACYLVYNLSVSQWGRGEGAIE